MKHNACTRWIAIFFLSFFLAGCGLSSMVNKVFVKETTAPSTPDKRHIDIRVRTAKDSNPGATGTAQPVKVCVIELKQKNWLPPRLEEGRPCTAITNGEQVLGVRDAIMPPDTFHDFSFSAPYTEERHFMVAAEFQKANAASAIFSFTAPASLSKSISILISSGSVVESGVPKPY